MRTIVLKLRIDEAQREALLRTMQAYTVAFNMAAEWGFRNRTYNRISTHFGTYRRIRDFLPGLNSSLVQAARDSACEALKGSKLRVKPARRKYAALRYNKNAARIILEHGFASLSTVMGRMKLEFLYPEYYFKKYRGWRIVSATLSFEKGKREFYLGVSIEKEDIVKVAEGKVLGVDRGLKNLVVTSDNRFFNSKKMRGVRGRYAHNRATLQAKGTRSAKRRLRKMAGRERRFIACENHRIAKQIVNTEFQVIVLENLKGIGKQRTMTNGMPTKLKQWPFHQLQEFIEYKAEELGKVVIFVDPRHTSQRCNRCGHVEKSNRKGNLFKCMRCGYQLNPDLNAARNIADSGMSRLGRLPVNQPNASCDEGRTLKWDSGVVECRRKIIPHHEVDPRCALRDRP